MTGFLQKQLGAEVSIQKVRTNLFGDFTFHGVKMARPVQLDLSQITLKVRPHRLTLVTESASLGNIRFNWRPIPFGNWSWRANFRVENLKSEDVLANLRKKFPSVPELSGSVNAEGTLRGTLRPKATLTDWGVSVSGKRLVYERPNGAGKLPFSTLVHMNPNSVLVESLTIRSKINLKGSIDAPWKSPVLHMTLRADNASVPHLLETIFPNSKHGAYGGRASFLAQIEGPLERFTVTGNGSADATYSKMKFPELQAAFTYANKKLEASADFAQGRVDLNARFSEPAPVWDFNVSNVSLEAVAQANDWKTVGGILDSKLRVGGNPESLLVDGSLDIDKFRWGRFKASKRVMGRININDRLVRIETDAFKLKVSVRDLVAKVEEMRLTFGKDSRIAASGTVHLENKALDLAVNANNIPPDLWPPLVERYPAITGAMDIKGPIKGSIEKIVSDLDVSFDGLKFLPTGGSWKGSAKFHGSPDEVSLTDIQVAGGYSGDVLWTPSKREGRFKIKANLDQANPALFFDIMKSTAQSGGSVTGQVDVELRDLKPIGVSSFSWTNGLVGKFRFDALEVGAHFQGDKVLLDSFALRYGPRALQGSGEAVFRNNGWDTLATVQMQHVGTAAFYMDGEAQWEGRISWPGMDIKGTMRAPLVWLNDFSVENLQADIQRTGPVIKVKGDANKLIHFNAAYNQSANYMDGSFHGEGLQLEEFLSKAVPDTTKIPKGTADIALKFKGPIGKLALTVDVNTKQVEWRKEKFGVNASFKINGSTISVSKAEAHLEKGGDVKVSGTISRTEVATFALKGQGSQLNMQSIFNLLEWPVKWEGKTDVSLDFSGPVDQRVTRVAFHGTHRGFGPFPLGGTISGNVTEVNRQWDLSGIRITSGDGFGVLLPGSNIYMDKNGAAAMRVMADSRNLRAGVMTFYGGVEVTGAWKGKSKIDPEAPKSPIELDVFARSLWVNQYVLDGNVTHLTLRQGEVEFSPILGSNQQVSGILMHANYPDIEMKAFRLVDGGMEKCFLDGHVGPGLWDYTLRLKEIDAGILRSLFDTSVPITGKMDADLRGLGSVKAPNISGNLTLRDGRLDSLPIDAAETKISYKDGIIDAQDIKASRKRGYQLTGRVKFQADADADEKVPPEIDLSVEKGDLAFLRDVWPEVSKARGAFTARFQMGTKSYGRSVSGFLNAQKISITSAHTPSLQKGEIKVRLDRNRLHVEDARARLGNGNIELTGYVDFKNGAPNFYNLSLRTTTEHGVSIRVPELAISPGPFLGQFGILKRRLAGASRGEPLINLILKGAAESPLLAGTIELENAIFTYPPAVTANKLEQKVTAFRKWAKHFWNNLKVDISLVAGSRTWYQNELVDANITGDIHFTGPTTDLDVNGRIHTEQGSIVYSGSEFRIKDAMLELVTKDPAFADVNAKHTAVYLRATAEKQVFYTDGLSNNNQDTIVMTVDRSLIGEIQPRFYSRYNPNLSPERALQLALGLPLSTSVDDNSLLPDQRATKQADQREDTDKMLRLGLVQLLDSSLASPLARALARNTGLIDVVRITYQEHDPLADNVASPADQEATNSVTQNQFLKYAKGTKVKFGRGISSRLFADYSVRVDEYQNQVDFRHEVELSYQLKRNLYLRGVSELDDQRQLGSVPDRRAILENQWRFGLPKPRAPQKPLKESKATPARSLYTPAS